MNLFLLNVILALAYVALKGAFTFPNLAIGFLIGYAVLLVTEHIAGRPGYARRVIRILAFALFFTQELVKSNFRVAYDVLSPRPQMSPAVVAIPLDVTSDLEITLLANLITLTPGTLSLDVSTDKRTLYIHAMYVEDVHELRHSIKDGFERRLMEVMR